MSSSSLSHLFTPVSLGPVTVKNRLYMGPHVTLFADDDGLPDQRYIDYIEERARGGVGAISSGMYVVMPNAVTFLGCHIAYDERIVPRYRRLTSAIHRYGAVAFCQLCHTGRQTDSTVSRMVMWAPSALPSALIREMPKEMDGEEIHEVVAAFAHAAGLAQAGGFDGVELHAATGYLIEQFLSPFSNHRTDLYGGSLENRMRFLMEIIDAVRARCGERFVIGVKLTVRQLVPGGLILDEGKQIAARLAEKGVTFIQIGDGPYEGLALEGSGMHQPRGMAVEETLAVRTAVRATGRPTAVICNRRINDPVLADQIIARGQADLVSMARALICDPYLPVKAAEGRLQEIRVCIACNQECMGRLFTNKPISCIHNPAVGKEARWGETQIRPATVEKRVTIVGGGPAGLKAAEIAARRGHRVTLYERTPVLGGKALLAARGAYRQEFAHLVHHLTGQVERFGVTIHLNTEVTREALTRLDSDTIIVATGAEQARPSFAGSDLPALISLEAILQGQRPATKRVVVLDYDGYWQGISSAELLAGEGWQVTLATPLPAVAMDIPYKADVTAALRRLSARGVTLMTSVTPTSFDGNRLTLRHGPTESESSLDGVGTLVWTGLYRSENRLYRELKTAGRSVIAVGDCLAPRTATSAILEGFRVAMEL